jgi:hypothetical protein
MFRLARAEVLASLVGVEHRIKTVVTGRRRWYRQACMLFRCAAVRLASRIWLSDNFGRGRVSCPVFIGYLLSSLTTGVLANQLIEAIAFKPKLGLGVPIPLPYPAYAVSVDILCHSSRSWQSRATSGATIAGKPLHRGLHRGRITLPSSLGHNSFGRRGLGLPGQAGAIASPTARSIAEHGRPAQFELRRIRQQHELSARSAGPRRTSPENEGHEVGGEISVATLPPAGLASMPWSPALNERLRDFLAQTGMMSSLSDEDLAGLNAALLAIKTKMEAFPQPFIGDASAETCRDWLDRLLHSFDEFSFTGAVEAPTLAHFAIVASWWVVANRQAKAIRCLIDADMAGDSIPIARAMIEFSLSAVALSRDSGPLLNTIMRKTDDEKDYTLKLAQGGPLEMPAELLALVSKTPDIEGEGSPAKNFSKVCSLLGVGDTILIAWRIFSLFCHPTAATAYLLTQPSSEGRSCSGRPRRCRPLSHQRSRRNWCPSPSNACCGQASR